MSEDNPNDDGTFCWHKLVSLDPAKDISFYEALFGWKTESHPSYGKHKMFTKTNKKGDVEMVAGMLPVSALPEEAQKHIKTSTWMSYVQVEDLTSCVSSVRSQGGIICQDRQEIEEFGAVAIVMDKSGSVLGLWEPHKTLSSQF